MSARKAYKLLSVLGTLRAARRGPGALARRMVRREVNKRGNRALRRWKWTRP